LNAEGNPFFLVGDEGGGKEDTFSEQFGEIKNHRQAAAGGNKETKIG